MFGEQLVEAGVDAGFGRTFNQLVVIDRNKACLEVLKQQLAAGKKKIAIFYGASHAGLRQAPKGRGRCEANHQRVDRRVEPKITSRQTDEEVPIRSLLRRAVRRSTPPCV